MPRTAVPAPARPLREAPPRSHIDRNSNFYYRSHALDSLSCLGIYAGILRNIGEILSFLKTPFGQVNFDNRNRFLQLTHGESRFLMSAVSEQPRSPSNKLVESGQKFSRIWSAEFGLFLDKPRAFAAAGRFQT